MWPRRRNSANGHKFSLLDLDPAPRQAVVLAGGEQLTVRGLTPEDFIYFATRTDDLLRAMEGEITDDATLVSVLPAMIPEIIAAANDLRGNRQAIDAAANLPLGDMARIGKIISDLTFPEGFRPFVQWLTGLGLLRTAGEQEADSQSFADATAAPTHPNILG